MINLILRQLRRYGFFAGLFALVVICGCTTYIVRRYAKLNTWIAHTNEVLSTLADLDQRVERVETGVRGFVLTGDGGLLRQAKDAAPGIAPDFARLASLLGDNDAQLARLAEVRPLVEDYLARFTGVIRPGGPTRRLAEASIARIDRLDHVMNEMRAEERRLLDERTRDTEGFARLAAWLLAFGACTALTLVYQSHVWHLRRAKAEEAHADLLDSIFGSIGDGLIVVDPSGRFIHYNEPAARILGVNDAEAPTVEDLARIWSVTPETSPTRRALRGESVSDFEIKRRDADRFINVDSRPVLDGDGRLVGALAVVRDVTARRALEDEWKRARESALEASRLKSDFLANMSHEIRTPMNGVIGLSTLLLQTDLTDDQRAFTLTIKSSADALVSLINQILDHARIESGKLVLNESDFNLDDLVEGAVDLFRYLAREKGISLRVHVGASVPRALNGDADRLRQVLVNLIGNALKFTERGSVDLEIDGGPDFALRFNVRDTGPGLSAKSRQMLFGKFSQVHASHARMGTGLGLMISREIARAMGGDLTVESVEGQGACFTMSVHLGPALTCAIPARATSPSPLKGRVLVAEDQSVNQLVITKFLEHLGVTPKIVADGQAALTALETEDYDLVLMDCQMPLIDGYEATTRLRAREAGTGRHLPIVALTAEGTSGDRRRCFEVGMDDFLSKPVSLERLRVVLTNYLDDGTRRTILNDDREYDAAALARLKGFESGGRPLLVVLREDFGNASADVARLVRAGADGDWTKVRALAHSLKSSGRTLGLVRFGEVCQTLESYAGIKGVGAELAALPELHRAGCAWLDQELVRDQVGRPGGR